MFSNILLEGECVTVFTAHNSTVTVCDIRKEGLHLHFIYEILFFIFDFVCCSQGPLVKIKFLSQTDKFESVGSIHANKRTSRSHLLLF